MKKLTAIEKATLKIRFDWTIADIFNAAISTAEGRAEDSNRFEASAKENAAAFDEFLESL